jgi:hypothetical protein
VLAGGGGVWRYAKGRSIGLSCPRKESRTDKSRGWRNTWRTRWRRQWGVRQRGTGWIHLQRHWTRLPMPPAEPNARGITILLTGIHRQGNNSIVSSHRS